MRGPVLRVEEITWYREKVLHFNANSIGTVIHEKAGIIWATSTVWSLILAVVQWIHQRKKYFIALRLPNTTLGMGNGLLVHSHP